MTISREAQDFIKQCLAPDPRRRPAADQLLCHPWIKNMLIKSKGERTITDEQYTDIYLNMYTFKRCTVLQSSVISTLVELNENPSERRILTEMFFQLDT